LFQSAYSELAFLNTLWPELKKQEFLEALKAYSQRERRFGR
jgi:undecaprenyl diphosphate synthase